MSDKYFVKIIILFKFGSEFKWGIRRFSVLRFNLIVQYTALCVHSGTPLSGLQARWAFPKIYSWRQSVLTLKLMCKTLGNSDAEITSIWSKLPWQSICEQGCGDFSNYYDTWKEFFVYFGSYSRCPLSGKGDCIIIRKVYVYARVYLRENTDQTTAATLTYSL